jgi:hypothetical protein
MQRLTSLNSKALCHSRAATSADFRDAAWHKSSFSNLNGNCVEVSRARPGRIAIRDTKDKSTGPVLLFTDAEWEAFIAGAKEGQFDNL